MLSTNKELRYGEELQHILTLFPALYTLALSCSPHVETCILQVTLFLQ